MKLGLYSIFDRQASIFAPPFIAANNVIAQRFVRDEILSADCLPRRYPQDYDLFRICDWHQPEIEGEFGSPVRNSGVILVCCLLDLIDKE